MMISDQTRQGLTELLSRSVTGSVTSLGSVQPLATESWPQPEGADGSRLIVLTLSGYCFQSLMCVLAITRQATVELEDDQLHELANNLCGTFKRSLSRHFPELGMSTPNRLQVECLPYLQADRQPPLAVHCVDSNGIALYVSLLLQTDGEFNLPRIETDEPETDTTGELELF